MKRATLGTTTIGLILLTFANVNFADIIQGELVEEGKEPFAYAFTQLKTKPEHVHDYGMFKPHVCTAVAITPTLLLTAAHCIVDPQFYQFMITSAINASKSQFTDISIQPRLMTAHPVFSDPDFEGTEEERTKYDIAFIQVASPVLKPIRLPDLSKQDAYPIKTGENVKLVGYGISSLSVQPVWGTHVAVKRKSTMIIGDVFSDYFFIPGVNQNVAPGDSGGPVTIATPEGETLVGLISGMKDPEDATARGIFHRLTHESLCWVQSTSKENLGLDCRK